MDPATRQVVRDATPDEPAAVAALLADVYAAFRPRLSDDAWPRYLGEIVDVRSRLVDSQLIVADHDGLLVGTVALYPEATRSSLEHWPEGWASIRALAVRADARGLGVGRSLAVECIRRARLCGAKAIGLHTASFMTSATRLYRSLGFERRPDDDIEVGEMFIGRPLPPEFSWQAQAYWLDLA
ncbi:GNAT family N-acetyltransferase [Lentzea sp. NPDC051838]|uniref:GNAT family N-acetyltransferase n=1 Tax=Lentzea sp. NPDC051838 TaxID=3154849 RepID=UPI00342FE56C